MRHLLLISALTCAAFTVTIPSSVYAEAAVSSSYVVNGNAVRLRAEPNVSSPELAKLALGANVTALQKTPKQSTVNGKTAYWYQIKTDKATGWVFGGFLTAATTATNADTSLDLLRTKLKTENLSFEDAVAAYKLADKAIPQAKTRNAKGELELDKLIALQRSYDSIPADKMQQAPYVDWYKQHSSISFGDDPSGQYLVSTKPFWAVADQYKNDAIGDTIAWQAAQQRLGGECEGFIGCSSVASQRTDGEYLKRYPKGQHVKAALDNVTANFKYMLQEWNKLEQDTSDVNLKEWDVILSPQANNPNAKKALGYLKQMQGLKKK
jgi:hypothetical protein